MPSKDPSIIKKHRDAWYAKNKEKQIKRQVERRRELMTWLWAYKRTLHCTDCKCSFQEHPEWVDFHHLDPLEKEDTLIGCITSSKAKFEAELKKCIPLCSNCHRTRHRDYFPIQGE